MSILITILVNILINLLVSYLTKLIEKWLAGGVNASDAASFVASQKPEFIAMVNRRFWMGPGRLDRASKAYDLAVENMKNLPKAAWDENSADLVAHMACRGIADKI